LTAHWDQGELPPEANATLMADYRAFIEAIFAATHNKLLQLLARPLVSLRSSRYWDEPDQTLAAALEQEDAYMRLILTALSGRDPAAARAQMQELLVLPPEAVTAMQQTPIGRESKILTVNKPQQTKNP